MELLLLYLLLLGSSLKNVLSSANGEQEDQRGGGGVITSGQFCQLLCHDGEERTFARALIVRTYELIVRVGSMRFAAQSLEHLLTLFGVDLADSSVALGTPESINLMCLRQALSERDTILGSVLPPGYRHACQSQLDEALDDRRDLIVQLNATFVPLLQLLRQDSRLQPHSQAGGRQKPHSADEAGPRRRKKRHRRTHSALSALDDARRAKEAKAQDVAATNQARQLPTLAGLMRIFNAEDRIVRILRPLPASTIFAWCGSRQHLLNRLVRDWFATGDALKHKLMSDDFFRWMHGLLTAESGSASHRHFMLFWSQFKSHVVPQLLLVAFRANAHPSLSSPLVSSGFSSSSSSSLSSHLHRNPMWQSAAGMLREFVPIVQDVLGLIRNVNSVLTSSLPMQLLGLWLELILLECVDLEQRHILEGQPQLYNLLTVVAVVKDCDPGTRQTASEQLVVLLDPCHLLEAFLLDDALCQRLVKVVLTIMTDLLRGDAYLYDLQTVQEDNAYIQRVMRAYSNLRCWLVNNCTTVRAHRDLLRDMTLDGSDHDAVFARLKLAVDQRALSAGRGLVTRRRQGQVDGALGMAFIDRFLQLLRALYGTQVSIMQRLGLCSEPTFGRFMRKYVQVRALQFQLQALVDPQPPSSSKQ
jgi:hypothetical protein